MNKLIPKNIYIRIKKQGLLKTMNYAFFVFILQKFFLELKYVYEKTNNAIYINDKIYKKIKFEIIKSINDFNMNDKIDLKNFEGSEIFIKLDYEFNKNNKCIIVRNENEKLAGLCFLNEITNSKVAEYKEYLVYNAFVLPEFRGNDYFVHLLNESYRFANEISQGTGMVLRGNVAVGNYSSIKSFKKAGFICKKLIAKFKNKEIFSIKFQ